MAAYYYIEDLIDFDVNTELEIEEGLVLKVAPEEQLELLKRLLVQFGVIPFDFSLHEHRVKKRLESGGANLEKRKNDDFRYFVLEHSIGNHYDLNFAKALQLMDKDFFVPFGFAKSSEIGVSIKYSFEQLSAHTYFIDKNIINFDAQRSQFYPKKWDAKSFTTEDKAQFLKNLQLLRNFERIKDDYIHISKALDDFFKINEISNNSVFKIVSYIACLELLLVDNGMDRLKSINMQLQSKVNLINNRLDTPIIVSDFFKGPDSLDLGTVIGKIYNYRSSIAHGDILDFEKKLKVLEKVSYYDVLRFLRIILKQTVLFALQEPQMVTDLKSC
ncbi:hypothetical protein FVB32_14150 [Flagellimonas hymeniacidonis]|uniref:Uncharacterized protein n=1 Tax=Flagellimonas hymeniacidonis TaxID=2603628 RepID=A0A5C8V308_9FLAO|nr:HEPN domain-containing protein [Flagellimonas hymeniacidonis]TXN35711.1 hypothetical protein FVB32_14150 [Flagellimonas hymeniacidonis]